MGKHGDIPKKSIQTGKRAKRYSYQENSCSDGEAAEIFILLGISAILPSATGRRTPKGIPSANPYINKKNWNRLACWRAASRMTLTICWFPTLGNVGLVLVDLEPDSPVREWNKSRSPHSAPPIGLPNACLFSGKGTLYDAAHQSEQRDWLKITQPFPGVYQQEM